MDRNMQGKGKNLKQPATMQKRSRKRSTIQRNSDGMEREWITDGVRHLVKVGMLEEYKPGRFRMTPLWYRVTPRHQDLIAQGMDSHGALVQALCENLSDAELQAIVTQYETDAQNARQWGVTE